MTDTELVVAARTGESWAQEAIYRRYAPRLLNTATRLLQSRHDASDVLQDVFIDALESLRTLREPAALGAWLLRRTIGRCGRVLQRARWKSVFGVRHAPELTFASLAPQGCTAETRAELELISRALRDIPVRARVAWTLHRVDGETLLQIAALTDVSLATVKRDISIAETAIAQLTGEDP